MMCLCIIGSQRSSHSTSTTSGDLTGFRTSRLISSHSTWLTHVLLVTTTVRVINRVHCHTTNSRPFVSLGLVFMPSTTSLQQWLVSSTTTSDDANHSTAIS